MVLLPRTLIILVTVEPNFFTDFIIILCFVLRTCCDALTRWIQIHIKTYSSVCVSIRYILEYSFDGITLESYVFVSKSLLVQECSRMLQLTKTLWVMGVSLDLDQCMFYVAKEKSISMFCRISARNIGKVFLKKSHPSNCQVYQFIIWQYIHSSAVCRPGLFYPFIWCMQFYGSGRSASTVAWSVLPVLHSEIQSRSAIWFYPYLKWFSDLWWSPQPCREYHLVIVMSIGRIAWTVRLQILTIWKKKNKDKIFHGQR